MVRLISEALNIFFLILGIELINPTLARQVLLYSSQNLFSKHIFCCGKQQRWQRAPWVVSWLCSVWPDSAVGPTPRAVAEPKSWHRVVGPSAALPQAGNVLHAECHALPSQLGLCTAQGSVMGLAQPPFVACTM